jgi:hypothetical protein
MTDQDLNDLALFCCGLLAALFLSAGILGLWPRKRSRR